MDSLSVLVDSTVNEKEAAISITAGGGGGGSGVNSGSINLMLNNPAKETRSQKQIANQLALNVLKLNQARIIVTQQQTIGSGSGSRGLPVQFVIQAPDFEPGLAPGKSLGQGIAEIKSLHRFLMIILILLLSGPSESFLKEAINLYYFISC